MSSSKLFVAALSTLALLGAGCAPAATPETNTAANTTPSVTIPTTPSVPTTPEEDTNAPVKEFTVEGENFGFSLKEIKVNEGDLVKITFVNKEGFHDWVIDEFSAATKQLQVGESETIEFVADKAGTFEYYCSVGQHRAMGMVGNLIVE